MKKRPSTSRTLEMIARERGKTPTELLQLMAAAVKNLKKQRLRRVTKKLTLVNIAAEAGIDPRTLRSRLASGVAINDAVNSHWSHPRRVDSISRLAEEAGVPETTVRHRLGAGWSLDEALGRVKRPKKPSMRRLQVMDAANSQDNTYNLSVKTIEQRISRGDSLRDALARPFHAQKKPSISSIARAHGFNPRVVLDRVTTGRSLEEALATPVRVPDSHLRKIGKIALENGISLSTMYGRLKSGWSPHEASTRPVWPANPSAKTIRKRELKAEVKAWVASKRRAENLAIAAKLGINAKEIKRMLDSIR